MGELSQRLPEGGGAGDRHLGPQEDHQGNPDRLRQSGKAEKVKKCKKLCKKGKAKKQCPTIYPAYEPKPPSSTPSQFNKAKGKKFSGSNHIF